jgi:peptidyl-prolyl cis-trans isomerase C
MRTLYRLFSIALLAAALAACNSGSSGDDSAVLATVNGKPITANMMSAYVRSQTNGQDIQLNDLQRQAVLKSMVNMELLAQAARKDGVDRKPEVAADITMNDNGLLAQADVMQYLKDHQPTDAQLQAAYQEQVKGVDTHEYKARHILVKDEAQAKDIITQLGKGGNFAALAKKYSLDPGSKDTGGDLGDWFPGSSMVPEFGAALATLKKGEYTKEPVQSKYGWHVIQLEDVRSQPAPTFEQMHEKLAEQMQRKAMSDYLDQLRTGAKVVMKDVVPAAASAKAPQAAKP